VFNYLIIGWTWSFSSLKSTVVKKFRLSFVKRFEPGDTCYRVIRIKCGSNAPYQIDEEKDHEKSEETVNNCFFNVDWGKSHNPMIVM